MRCFIESKVKVMTNGGKVILQAGLIQRTIRSNVGSVKLGHYPGFIKVIDSGRVGGVPCGGNEGEGVVRVKGKRMNKRWLNLSIVVGLVCMLATPVLADFQAGLEAADRGDYPTAVKEFQLSAERGDVKARYNLGVMYQLGLGVPQDDQEAIRWYRLAAEQGDASAQFKLGVMYDKGKGVLKDYVLAHMWMNLAAAKGVKEAVKLRDLLEKNMTTDQIAEAQRLAKEWMPKGMQ